MNDDEKYLDPEQNPMIPGATADVTGTGEIIDPYLDPAQNPMIPESDGARYDLSAALSEKLAAAFPGKDEITIGSRILVRMATGTYTEKESGKSIGELAPAALLAINDFLASRQKG